MKKKLFSTLNFLAFFMLGLTLLWLVFRKVDVGNVVQEIFKANYWWILLSFFLGIISHLARAMRWNILINSMGYKTRTKTTFYAVMVGYFANLALPRLGEVSRCGMLSKRENIPFDSLFGSVVAERVFDLIVLIIMMIFVIVFQLEIVGGFVNKLIFEPLLSKFSNNLYGIFMSLIALIVLIVAANILYKIFKVRLHQSNFYIKISKFFKGFLDGLKTIMKLKRRAAFLFFTLIIWGMYFLMTYVVFFSLEATSHLTIIDGITVLTLGSLGMVAPVPGGLGAYHFIVKATLFEIYKIPNELAATWATLIHTSQSLMLIVVGIFSYFMLVGAQKIGDHAKN